MDLQKGQSPSATKSRVVELIVLIETVALAVLSLLWLAIATVQSPMDQVRWQLWMPTRTGDTLFDETMSTRTAVLISSGVMLTLVALAVLGHATALRWDRGVARISVASRWAALSNLPLTWSLPAQFAAYQQTRGWLGDSHGQELMLRYGTFPAFLLGIALLTGIREFVRDPSLSE